MPDAPHLLTATEAPHRCLKPGVLHVNGHQQEHDTSRHGAAAVGLRLRLRHQAISVDRSNGLILPSLGRTFVHPALQEQRVSLRSQELITDLLPACPAGRCIPSRQMEAGCDAVAFSGRLPLRTHQHRGLVMLAHALTAGRTLREHLAVRRIPLHVLTPAQHLQGAAAGHLQGELPAI